MNLIEIETYEEYLMCKRTGIEPLIMPELFDIKDRKFIIKKLFPKASPENDQKFYRWMWSIRRHWCQECGQYLPEYSSSFISHIKTRGAYTELRYDPLNINILCKYHHNLWEFGKKEQKEKMFIYQLNKIRNIL